MWPEMLPCGILFEILAVVVAGEGPPGRPPPVFGHVLNCKKRLSGHLGYKNHQKVLAFKVAQPLVSFSFFHVVFSFKVRYKVLSK